MPAVHRHCLLVTPDKRAVRLDHTARPDRPLLCALGASVAPSVRMRVTDVNLATRFEVSEQELHGVQAPAFLDGLQ